VLALWTRAEAQERLDHLDAAIDALWAAQRLGRSMPKTLLGVVAEGGLVKLLNDHGRRRDALALCEDAVAHYCDDTGEPVPLVGFMYSQMGGLYYEANELQAAAEAHARALALSESLGLAYELVYQRALAAPTWFAAGEPDRALAALRAGYRESSQKGYADVDWFLAWEASIRLWQGDYVFVRHWAATTGLSPQSPPRLLRIEQHITYARFLIAERRYADARHWLGRLESFTREHGLHRWLMTVRIQQAVVAERLGDRNSARSLLTLAIRGAAPEGYVRPFLVEDARIPVLLDDLRDVAPDFVDRIRAGAARSTPHVASAMPELTEPLTDRELEVLQMIAAGASNREIAEDLVITVGTVKRHTNHIYGKLGVHSRTEAVARARGLGLL
jgi:LuxR family maltose regulon positive regulatory protein